MTRRTSTWIAVTAGAAVVAAAVVFLLLQGSADKADKWSSIGGFITALVTVVMSGVAWFVRRDTGSSTAAPAVQGSPPDRPGRWAVLLGNRTVFLGDHQQIVHHARDDH